MSDLSNEEKISLFEAQKIITQSLGSTPDKETLLEWIKLGYLKGEEKGSEIYISQESINTLLEQLPKNTDQKRPPRLVLHAVDIWRRDEDKRAVAVTLSSKAAVVTSEKTCDENKDQMLTAAVQATLAAITEILGDKLLFELVQVKHHSLEKIEQSMVAVLLKAGQQGSMQTLSGVAMAENDSLPLQAAAKATLNALNRTLSSYINPQNTWRDFVKRFLPIS